MIKSSLLAVGVAALLVGLSNTGYSQFYGYGTPGVVVSTYRAPVYGVPVYRAPIYRAPVYAAPVYRAPVQVYRAPVYRYPVAPVARSGISIGIGIGGPVYGRGYGYPGYGIGPRTYW
jgi:hypothetical protein